MPRDLTELMERATSFAPPEPHTAADVTSLAATSLRRRRAGLAGAVALAVVVAGGLGYGVTRGHESTPEPAATFLHDRTVSFSDAVPAGSLPGYQLQEWTIPSTQGQLSTYQTVDGDGRLIVNRYPGDKTEGLPQVELYDHPGASPSPLRIPPSVGGNGSTSISWLPFFTDDGRLVWRPSDTITDDAQAGFHVTDLGGGHDVFVHSAFTVGNAHFGGTPLSDVYSASTGPGQQGWGLFGQRYWFAAYEGDPQDVGLAPDTLYTATFDGRLTKVADDVAVMSAKDGRIAWVTTQGQVMTETVDDPTPRRVPVPLTAGCRVPLARAFQGGLGMFAANRSVIALIERCGTGQNTSEELLAFDPSGRMLVHLTGATTYFLSLTPDAILGVAVGPAPPFHQYNVRYDLVSGRLAILGTHVGSRRLPAGIFTQPPRGAGDYVLWYDGEGGHVAEIPD